MTGAAATALVTGGRRGIGRATAYGLAEAGFAVAINDLVADQEVDETLAGLADRGARHGFVEADIADLEAHAPMLDALEEQLGPLDCLVNNAALQVPVRGDLLELEPRVLDRLIGVNLRGTLFLTQEVARRMAERPDAARSIITITSVNAALASVEKAAYCISKAALSMASQLFAVRLADLGIDVFEIRPGLIRTEMTASVREAYGARIDRGLSLTRRWGEPEEVARAVVSLATGAMPFATGAIVDIGGGLHVARL